jgi:integrase
VFPGSVLLGPGDDCERCDLGQPDAHKGSIATHRHVAGRRDRIADPSEAALLLAALPEKDRALWATALYAGLRRGELMALRWEDVDLAAGLIRVERSWDVREGIIEPKSRAGRRRVPIAAVLRDYLDEHKLATERSEGLVFGCSETRPFEPVSLAARAATAWMNAKRKEQELDPRKPITLHEARHTFASLMIAAGVNAKALSTYIGHWSRSSGTLGSTGDLSGSAPRNSTAWTCSLATTCMLSRR